IAWHYTTCDFTFLDVLTGPKCTERVRVGVQEEFLALDQGFGEIYGIIRDADMGQHIPAPDEMLDEGHLIAGRGVCTPVPALFDMRRGHRQHVAFPDSGRESHPRVWRVFGRVRASVHPDRPFLLVGADGLLNRNELVG